MIYRDHAYYKGKCVHCALNIGNITTKCIGDRIKPHLNPIYSAFRSHRIIDVLEDHVVLRGRYIGSAKRTKISCQRLQDSTELQYSKSISYRDNIDQINLVIIALYFFYYDDILHL